MQKQDDSQQLKREITAFRQRLDRLNASGNLKQAYLINAYKRGLRIRSLLLENMGGSEQDRP